MSASKRSRSPLLGIFLGLALSLASPVRADDGCRQPTSTPEGTLRKFLTEFENVCVELEHNDSPETSERYNSCRKNIVRLTIDGTEYDNQLYYRLMKIISDEGLLFPGRIVALAELGYALQAEYDAKFLPRYYEQEGTYQEAFKQGADLGFALGFIISANGLRKGFTVARSARALVTTGGATTLVNSLVRKDRKTPAPPSMLLSFVSDEKGDAITQVSNSRQNRDLWGRGFGVVAALGVARLTTTACARMTKQWLLKGGCFVSSLALAWWADDVVRDAFTDVSDFQMKNSLRSDLGNSARDLERAASGGPGNERPDLELAATHKLLESALKLAALQTLQGLDITPGSADLAKNLSYARDFAARQPEFETSRRAATAVARIELINELEAGGALASHAESRAPASLGPVGAAMRSEIQAFHGQSREKDFGTYLRERQAEDEREFSEDLKAGVTHTVVAELWLQVRAVLKSVNRPFLNMYIENIVEPRISRSLVANEMFSSVSGGLR